MSTEGVKITKLSQYKQSGELLLPDAYFTYGAKMRRKPVISSNISSVGYDSETSTLEVEFKNFTIYQFSMVPESIYQGLMNAISHGKYFYARIRNVFPYQRIR